MHRYFSSLQNFLYPPEVDPPQKGHGMTLRKRFPSLSPQEIKEIKEQPLNKAGVMLVALITGIACGAAAALLKFSIGGVSRLLTWGFAPETRNWWMISLPLTGILLTGIFQRYIVHTGLFHGEGRLRDDFRRNQCYIPSKLTFLPMIAATLTLGFGCSAGSEGPIAYTGGAIGSNIGGWFKMSPKTVRALTAIGAGAGIAGIFKAPIGGVLFTIEVLGIGMSVMAVAALVIACVSSAITAYVLSGCRPDIAFGDSTVISLDHFGLILLFGVFCGIYSAYYSTIMKWLQKALMAIKNPWVKNTIAGLIVGALVFMFPCLYGEGYGLVGKLLAGNFEGLTAGGIIPSIAAGPLLLLLSALGVMLAKCFATSATNNGGGVAGNFAPTIMIGSVVGIFYAFLFRHYLGVDLPIPDYVFMGMAGILAGAIKAPLMSMFLITEMATMGYQQFMPIAIVASISYLTVCLITRIRRTV